VDLAASGFFIHTDMHIENLAEHCILQFLWQIALSKDYKITNLMINIWTGNLEQKKYFIILKEL